MKANGITTSAKASDTKDSATIISMKANIKMERFMGKESTSGPVARYSMDNGLQAKNMDMVSGKALNKTHTSGNGSAISPMDLESPFGEMEMFMKVNGIHVSDMVKDVIILLSATHTLENIVGAKLKVTVNMLGVTAIYIQDNSSMARKMGKVNGRRMAMMTQMNTWAGIKTTKSMVMVSLNGPLEASTKVTISTILNTDMEKCTGLTILFTEDTGTKVFKMVLVL